MTQDTTFTDAQLTAYLDGEADDALRAAVDAALTQDAALGERIAELDIDVAGLNAAFDGMLADAPAMPDLDGHVVTPAANTNARPGILGGLVLFGTGIAAGIAVMLMLDTTPPAPKAPGWKAVVASYQSLYSEETIAGWKPTDAQAQTQLAKVSEFVGADLTTLPAVQGLTFKRAQILEFNGKPLIQIAFARADGTPVALCIIAAKSKDAKAMQDETLGGLAAASWNKGGLAYLLIGGTAQPETAQEARAFEMWSNTVTDI